MTKQWSLAQVIEDPCGARDEIERLRSENAAAMKVVAEQLEIAKRRVVEPQADPNSVNVFGVVRLTNSELTADAQDAARYRWLRRYSAVNLPPHEDLCRDLWAYRYNHDEIDKKFDDAMAASVVNRGEKQ